MTLSLTPARSTSDRKGTQLASAVTRLPPLPVPLSLRQTVFKGKAAFTTTKANTPEHGAGRRGEGKDGGEVKEQERKRESESEGWGYKGVLKKKDQGKGKRQRERDRV